MSNPYYTFGDTLTPGTKARTGPLIVEFQAIEAAFDGLPADLSDLASGTNTAGTESGSGNAYVVTMPTTRTQNSDNDEVVFKAAHTNTGASTVQIDGLAPVAIRRHDGTALLGGDIQNGRFYVLRYDGNNGYFVIIAPPLGTAAGSVDFDSPSVSVTLSGSAGAASTALRSDAGLALSQAIAPTWTAQHTFTVKTLFASGTVASPGIAFASDTDTDLGLYRISEDTMGVASDGTLVFSFGLAATTFYNALTAGAGATLNMTDKAFSRAICQDLAEKVTAATISSGVLTLDYEQGPIFTVTNNANITSFAISNWPASGNGAVVLILTGNGSSYTQSWGTAVKWPGGLAPTITTTSGKRDYIVFNSYDGGTTVDASRVRANVG